MSAERGWLGEPPPPCDYDPAQAYKWHKMMGAAGPCPVCGQPIRYKQFRPIFCDCNQSKEAQEAHRRYAEEGTWRATQHPPSSVQ